MGPGAAEDDGVQLDRGSGGGGGIGGGSGGGGGGGADGDEAGGVHASLLPHGPDGGGERPHALESEAGGDGGGDGGGNAADGVGELGPDGAPAAESCRAGGPVSGAGPYGPASDGQQLPLGGSGGGGSGGGGHEDDVGRAGALNAPPPPPPEAADVTFLPDSAAAVAAAAPVAVRCAGQALQPPAAAPAASAD
jgi:hypothetical protein